MNLTKKTLGVDLLIGLGLTGLQAQEAIPASGIDGSVNCMVGQVVYATNTGANGSFSQGVQQPYEISVISELNKSMISI